jgi:hypothetical protein
MHIFNWSDLFNESYEKPDFDFKLLCSQQYPVLRELHFLTNLEMNLLVHIINICEVDFILEEKATYHALLNLLSRKDPLDDEFITAVDNLDAYKLITTHIDKEGITYFLPNKPFLKEKGLLFTICETFTPLNIYVQAFYN